MTPAYRALCANLTAALNDWQCETGDDRYEGLLDRARALLAEPEPEGPTDEELDELFTEIDQSGEALSWRLYARAALSRWGRPTPQPVPLSERLPGAEDCDAEGRCWWLIEPYPRPVGPGGKLWSLCRYYPGAALWLPAHALPLPTPEAND